MRLKTIDDVFISVDDANNLTGEFVPDENMAEGRKFNGVPDEA